MLKPLQSQLGVPGYLVKRSGTYLSLSGKSFTDHQQVKDARAEDIGKQKRLDEEREKHVHRRRRLESERRKACLQAQRQQRDTTAVLEQGMPRLEGPVPPTPLVPVSQSYPSVRSSPPLAPSRALQQPQPAYQDLPLVLVASPPSSAAPEAKTDLVRLPSLCRSSPLVPAPLLALRAAAGDVARVPATRSHAPLSVAVQRSE